MPFSVSPSLARKLLANVGSTEESPASAFEKPVKVRKSRKGVWVLPESKRGLWHLGKHVYRALSSHMYETKCGKWTSREPVGDCVECEGCKEEAHSG